MSLNKCWRSWWGSLNRLGYLPPKMVAASRDTVDQHKDGSSQGMDSAAHWEDEAINREDQRGFFFATFHVRTDGLVDCFLIKTPA